MEKFSVTSEAIDCALLASLMKNDAAGGFVSFEGWVRNNNEGLSVNSLEYEVFTDLAQSEGEKILDEAISRFGLIDAKAVHREGSLAIGDCAIWIGVTAGHRGEAFTACRYIIDEMKHRLPVWKKEHYKDLEPQWINCQHAHHHKPPVSFNKEDYYSRQTILPEIGSAGQNLLNEARVLIIGVGGLGSSAALTVAGAGIGTIGLADYDVVSISNLHRQVLYAVEDIGKQKTHLAAARLKALNPFIGVMVHAEKVTADNVEKLFDQYDIVLDCTDNFSAKYLLSDASILYKKPVIQASIYRFEGQLLTIDAEDCNAGCLRCLFPEPPAPGLVGDCATAGVLGSVPMLFGTLQANEAIKRILGLETLASSFMTFDLVSMQSQKLQRKRNPDCKICGEKKSISILEPNVDMTLGPEDTNEDLRRRFVFIDVREAWELEKLPLTGAVHLPTSSFNIDALNFAKDKALLVVCAHGVRSQTVAAYLRQAGWNNCYSLSGGIGALPEAQGVS